MDKFFGGKNDFFKAFSTLKDPVCTVVVIYQDGFRKEYPGITNAWKYMAKLKTNPRVKHCFIKNM
jgi:hypothetical protein